MAKKQFTKDNLTKDNACKEGLDFVLPIIERGGNVLYELVKAEKWEWLAWADKEGYDLEPFRSIYCLEFACNRTLRLVFNEPAHRLVARAKYLASFDPIKEMESKIEALQRELEELKKPKNEKWVPEKKGSWWGFSDSMSIAARYGLCEGCSVCEKHKRMGWVFQTKEHAEAALETIKGLNHKPFPENGEDVEYYRGGDSWWGTEWNNEPYQQAMWRMGTLRRRK